MTSSGRIHRTLDGIPSAHANSRVFLDPVSPGLLEANHGNKPSPALRLSRRQLIFRCVRLVLAGALVSSTGLYVRTSFTTIKSEQAYINAEITALRAPIAGQVRLEPFELGRTLSLGSALFSIENARFGNQETASQLNWVKELAERLQAESDEALVRYHQQEEVFQLHEKLYAELLISRLAFLEEQTRLALARSAMTSKQSLAAQAEKRCIEIQRQVELQKAAIVRMPFEGVAWTIPAKNGVEVSIHETVLEVINPKRIWVDAFFHERHAKEFLVGTKVNIQTMDGGCVHHGTVESVRGGVGSAAGEGVASPLPTNSSQRIAVRIKMDTDHLFDASEFFGVGRSVVVTLSNHE